MNLQRDLPLRLDANLGVRMVVETPRGSGVKLAYEQAHGAFLWSRPLIAGLTFPYDFGFLPQTLGDDGDALDAMLLTDQGSFPGVVVPARVLGALRIEQYRDGQPIKRNDRLMLLPVNDHRSGDVRDVDDLAQRVREEIEAFFMASLQLTGKKIKLCGWAGATEAEQLIDQAAQRFV